MNKSRITIILSATQQYYSMLLNVIICSSMSYYAPQCHIMLLNVILCSSMLHYAPQCHTMLLNVVLSSSMLYYSYQTSLQVSADLSFLCISTDEEKMTVFSYATDAAVALKEGGGGIRANDWVSRTLQVCNNYQWISLCKDNSV